MVPHNPHLTADQKIIGDVYTRTEVMDNLTVLCDEFGSRFGGTPGEKQAAEFFKLKMEAYGLQNVHFEEVHYEGWRRGAVTLEILKPIQRAIPCISLPHSPPAMLEAALVDLDEGAPEDFNKRAEEMADKIVLASSELNPKGVKRWIHRNEKYGRALLAGASGFIFVNHYPGYGPATGGIGEVGAGHIPAVGVALEDGRFLQRLLKKYGRLKLRLASTDVIEPMVSWNIIGDLPGTTRANELDNIRFYLNLDSAGVTPYKDLQLNQWEELAPVFEGWREEMAHDFRVGQTVTAFSDHYPFLLAGVPTGGVGGVRRKSTGGRGFGHTRYDTLDKVEIRSLREAAVFAARLALRIAYHSDWPARRRTEAAVAEVLDSPDNQEETEIFDRIRAFYAEQHA